MTAVIYHRIYKVLQEINENNQTCNRFLKFHLFKISDSSSRFQILLGILNDLCWIPVGVRPLELRPSILLLNYSRLK